MRYRSLNFISTALWYAVKQVPLSLSLSLYLMLLMIIIDYEMKHHEQYALASYSLMEMKLFTKLEIDARRERRMVMTVSNVRSTQNVIQK